VARCPYCDYPLSEDRERLGARCPRCHDPLYEPAGRIPRLARAGEASCPVHAGMESVGECARCGEQVCEACRTRWRSQILCAACVDRAMQTHEATPEQARAHRRQAERAVQLGGGAWVPSAIALGVLLLAGSQPPVVLMLVVFLVLAADVLVAALGVGQAVAALQTRGERNGLAGVGLVLGGLYIGVMLGLGTMFFWQS
jgi:hypothetical protein